MPNLTKCSDKNQRLLRKLCFQLKKVSYIYSKYITMKSIALFFFISLLLFSCKKDEDNSQQAEADEKIIQQYISDHNLNATATGSGLYVVIENPGSGAQPNANSDVKVVYAGYYTDGNVFDQSSALGATFNLQNVIQGWTEGIPYFKEGGNGKLLIPSALGYGAAGSGNIPPNTVIIFDVALIDVL